MKILGVYLFGSRARGDADTSSDTDVLIVYAESPAENQRTILQQQISNELREDVTFAEYSIRRLQKMFDEGHLFAWHLFQEAIPIQSSVLTPKEVMGFWRPAPYRNGRTDASHFTDLIRSIGNEITGAPASLVHEAGLTYLALRNIAMSMSATFLPRVDFTRLSPISLSTSLAIEPPCSIADYEMLIAARHASQRGTAAPAVDAAQLTRIVERSTLWADRVIGGHDAK
jgi:predicted nucleotidyltransferase